MSVHVKMTDPITLMALDYLRHEFGIMPSDVFRIKVEGANDDVSTVTVTLPIRAKTATVLGDPHGPHPHDGARCLDCPDCVGRPVPGSRLTL